MPKIVALHYKKLVRVFEQDGFTIVRQEGSHIVLTKLGILRPVVIPTYDEIPVFIIKNCLRTARMSRDRYFELLENM
ncbi:type II toxin-antitoxin system HicA family toxin [Candidatus Uhrbacteria bacterium]|nr:type II toxin-antitoxin system HicA family toxin [Candidatus Uhrbacteria bacterium]